jgi:hypothetical protein
MVDGSEPLGLVLREALPRPFALNEAKSLCLRIKDQQVRGPTALLPVWRHELRRCRAAEQLACYVVARFVFNLAVEEENFVAGIQIRRSYEEFAKEEGTLNRPAVWNLAAAQHSGAKEQVPLVPLEPLAK